VWSFVWCSLAYYRYVIEILWFGKCCISLESAKTKQHKKRVQLAEYFRIKAWEFRTKDVCSESYLYITYIT